jgi:hypothetical protein
MARWTAKCWLGSASGYQNLEVQSNTAHGAKEQLQRIYGAEQIINLRQVNESKPSFSSGDDNSFGGIFVAFLIVIALAITYWPITLAIAALFIIYKIFV